MIGLRIVILCGIAFGLSGCGTINSWLARNTGDLVPQWAGGLPPDAPPRPGTVQYEQYRNELARNTALPIQNQPQPTQNQPQPTPPAADDSSSSQAIY
jgi:hypothetical protein